MYNQSNIIIACPPLCNLGKCTRKSRSEPLVARGIPACMLNMPRLRCEWSDIHVRWRAHRGSNIAGFPERFFGRHAWKLVLISVRNIPRQGVAPSPQRGIFPQQRRQESNTCISVAERFLDQDVSAQSGRPTRQPVQEPDARPKR